MADPAPLSERLYTITELARELGVTARAIRFYESKRLLEPQRVGANRVYTHRDRGRLMLVLRGKRLGFSLASIKQYLDLYDAEPTHRTQLLHLLSGTRRRIAELEQQRQDLELSLDELREIERQTLEAMGEAAPAAGARPARTSRAVATADAPSPKTSR